MRLAVLLTYLTYSHADSKQDGISLLYACLQHFLDRKEECPKVRRGRGSGLVRWAGT
jgi:hypothetical protein